jgi:hypothetical protein
MSNVDHKALEEIGRRISECSSELTKGGLDDAARDVLFERLEALNLEYRRLLVAPVIDHDGNF